MQRVGYASPSDRCIGICCTGLDPDLNQTSLWHRRYSLMKQALSPDNRDSFSKKKALALSRAIYVDEWNLCIVVYRGSLVVYYVARG